MNKANTYMTENRKSFVLFVAITISIFMLSFLNWNYELKPRLVSESVTNMQIIATSRAHSIEAQFQTIKNKADFSIINDSLYEVLLIEEPTTNEKIFIGVSLSIDSDAFLINLDTMDVELGNTKCVSCYKTQNPIYNHKNGELIAIITLYSNPVFYQRLLADVKNEMTFLVIGILLLIFIAWYLTSRLMLKLKDNEGRLRKEITDRKSAEAKLRKFATYDQLTGLPNRYLLNIEFVKKINETKRYNNKLAVLFFDLDHFKVINDIYGHETGDLLLQGVAQRVSQLVRSYDLFARFGGDEFVLIMPRLNDLKSVYRIVENIINCFDEDFKLGQRTVKVTTSIGVSIYPDDGDNKSTLIKNADLAMYRAKLEGRNGFSFFTKELNENLVYTQTLEQDLKSALEKNELELYFHPQLDVTTGKILSCETLIRWPQSDGTFIEPSTFIPIAEKSGLINDITLWVMNKACSYQKAWSQKETQQVRLDINLSAKDFLNQKTANQLIDIFNKEGCTKTIGLEITESLFLKSSDEVIQTLAQLKNMGVHISIDDFGTGYSSLKYLKDFPISCLKIDRTFIKNIPNISDEVLIQGIISVSLGLGMSVIAEGIETAEQKELLEKLGCNILQGYYFSKPLTAKEFERFYLTIND